jgi:glutathione-regulated potassium-efflux system ancillary protein KefG
MKRILILLAHPRFEDSRANRALLKGVASVPGVRLHDLYQAYPGFDIDVEREKALLAEHELLVWQHPLYWYSAPPMLKQWIDLCLELGWAYGPGGEALRGKRVFNCFTSGGPRAIYCRDGRNRFTIREFFRPFEQTAFLCHMRYLPPFGVHGAHRLGAGELSAYALAYRQLLHTLAESETEPEALLRAEYANDWLASAAGADPRGLRPASANGA